MTYSDEGNSWPQHARSLCPLFAPYHPPPVTHPCPQSPTLAFMLRFLLNMLFSFAFATLLLLLLLFCRRVRCSAEKLKSCSAEKLRCNPCVPLLYQLPVAQLWELRELTSCCERRYISVVREDVFRSNTLDRLFSYWARFCGREPPLLKIYIFRQLRLCNSLLVFFWQEHLVVLSALAGGLCGRAANNGQLLTAGGSIKTFCTTQLAAARWTNIEQCKI